MKPSQVVSSLNLLIDKQQPCFIWGPPGVGKSDVVAQVVGAHPGFELRDVRMNLLDPVDLKGFPVPDVKAKAMTWLPADFLPRSGKGILFLDEFNSALPATQASGYQLILNRRIGDYQLPDGWAIVAAGNRDGDRGVTHRMPSPLANRLVHLDFDVHNDEWAQWALDNGIQPELLAFIRFRPALLHKFDPSENPRAFPSPRSWMFVNKIFKSKLDRDLEFELITGAVGEGAAGEFLAFTRVIAGMPNLDEIVVNPDGVEVPTEPATLYAVSTGLATRAAKDNFDRLMKFANRMPVEFQVQFVRDSVRRKRDVSSTKSYTQWSVKNEAVLVGS